ncbi:YutD family protein [Furfurilactobacillus entadae]|uniref:YutD family protein n=1 Tax=Furfurilactobacillus entadae TaxID=2922307 RepID=UPI0035E766AB
MIHIDREHIQQLAQEAAEKRAAVFTVVRENEEQFFINGHPYELVTNFHDAFDVHKFAERYSTVLSKYDFIVGDWGFDQLRLKGFYVADKENVPVSQTVTGIQDYLYEYCNFGCAYFVLHNLDVEIEQQDRPQKAEHKRSRRRRNGRHGAANEQKQRPKAEAKAPRTSTQSKTTGNKKAAPKQKAAQYQRAKGQEQPEKHQFKTRQKSRGANGSRGGRKQQAHVEERVVTKALTPTAGTGQQATSSNNRKPGRRHFTIRQKGDHANQPAKPQENKN